MGQGYVFITGRKPRKNGRNLLGLLAAILFVSYGFFKTLFIIICIATGYFIGKQLDENKDFENWLNRIFKK